MLNKKGNSLLELIISIALISIVMAFLVKLLVDLNNKETNNDFAVKNQINRAEIIRAVESDLINKKLKSITDTASTKDTLKVTFTFLDNTTGVIEATKNKFTYTNTEDKIRTWTIKGATLDNIAHIYYDKDDKKDGSDDLYSLVFSIEVYTTNDNNMKNSNNTLDDITLAYIGKVSDNNTTYTCLGYNCKY